MSSIDPGGANPETNPDLPPSCRSCIAHQKSVRRERTTRADHELKPSIVNRSRRALSSTDPRKEGA
jgi:hypothetical protein